MSFVLSSLSEGLLWSIMAIGVYLTFRILDIADMTAEGAFPLGGSCRRITDTGRDKSLDCDLTGFGQVWLLVLCRMLHTKMKIQLSWPGIVTLTGSIQSI